jgi:DNA-binding transcriptional MerR regulator
MPARPRISDGAVEECAMTKATWKVGDLASKTGLTVRTLHHYDEIGLLKPSLRTEAGHRLYTTGDVVRLQQVLSLRQLGFSLEEILGCLDQPGFEPVQVLRLHVRRLREQIELQQRLCLRLESLAVQFERAEEVSANALIHAIEEMTMLDQLAEKYFTPQQLKFLKQRHKSLRPQDEWAEVLSQTRTEMEKGTDPTSAKVLTLARRWRKLIDDFTAGDKNIEQGLHQIWAEHAATLVSLLGSQFDPRGVAQYIQPAMTIIDGPP